MTFYTTFYSYGSAVFHRVFYFSLISCYGYDQLTLSVYYWLVTVLLFHLVLFIFYSNIFTTYILYSNTLNLHPYNQILM